MIENPTPVWLERQTQLSLDRLLPRLRAQFAAANPVDWRAFESRLAAHFSVVFKLLVQIYLSIR